MQARGLVMLCANPDIVVERGGKLIPCAGAIAAAYEAIGGRTFYTGKPHRPIYEAALGRAARIRGVERIDASRVLAIGDAIRTDVAGAASVGADSLFIARGIHAGDLAVEEGGFDPERARAWFSTQDHRPSAALDRLIWKE
jgi:ribonucleotide monophosphatase NagD (HAD superfamily)